MVWLLLSSLNIFVLRTIDVTLYTLRILLMRRNQKVLTWLFGCLQALIFVYVIKAVLINLSNWMSVLSYASGFATGMLIGMIIEGKLSIGHLHMQVISSGYGSEIAEQLRREGFGVTQMSGRGRDGAVDLISCDIYRKDKNHLRYHKSH